jgi:hypothetical protein
MWGFAMRGLTALDYELLAIVANRAPDPEREPTRAEIRAGRRLLKEGRWRVVHREAVITPEGLAAMHIHEAIRMVKV